MPALLAGLLALFLILSAIKQFGRLRPADAARLVRRGRIALGVLGVVLLVVRGQFGLAGALASVLLGFCGRISRSTITMTSRKIPRTTMMLLRCLPMVGETFVPFFLTERFSLQPRPAADRASFPPLFGV